MMTTRTDLLRANLRSGGPLLAVVAAVAVGSATYDADASPGAVAVCGAFAAIDDLVEESTVPDPGPAGLPSRTYDLVGLANALNLQRPSLSADLDTDVAAYVYALTEAGAALNHHEPTDFTDVTATRERLVHRCQRHRPLHTSLPDIHERTTAS